MPYGTINGTINAQTITSGGITTTTSTTDVSTGIGLAIGANYTARFLILYQSVGSNNTANSGLTMRVYRTTGTIPTSGSAVTGSSVGGATNSDLCQIVSATANAQGTLVGLVIDTPGIGFFSYYLSIRALTSGTATIPSGNNSINLTVVEI
jgi:hypothetical protein